MAHNRFFLTPTMEKTAQIDIKEDGNSSPDAQHPSELNGLFKHWEVKDACFRNVELRHMDTIKGSHLTFYTYGKYDFYSKNNKDIPNVLNIQYENRFLKIEGFFKNNTILNMLNDLKAEQLQSFYNWSALNNKIDLFHNSAFRKGLTLYPTIALETFKVAAFYGKPEFLEKLFEFILKEMEIPSILVNNMLRTSLSICVACDKLSILKFIVKQAESNKMSLIDIICDTFKMDKLTLHLGNNDIKYTFYPYASVRGSYDTLSGTYIKLSPLFWAVRLNKYKAVIYLLHKYHQLGVNTTFEHNPLPKYREEIMNYVQISSRVSDSRRLLKLLIQSSDDLTFNDTSLRTPLHEALICKNWYIGKYLLKRKPEYFTIKDSEKKKPLDYVTDPKIKKHFFKLYKRYTSEKSDVSPKRPVINLDIESIETSSATRFRR